MFINVVVILEIEGGVGEDDVDVDMFSVSLSPPFMNETLKALFFASRYLTHYMKQILTTDMYVALSESGPLSTLLILLGPDEKAPGTNI